MRLQCYEGLDEAKALYEWNYRKQLLRIQAEADGTGWDAVQDDIFGEEFLLARPLMPAIASEEPVVLLIDEIDKTDQEFEAMLLELLSDFQITIPELGRIEARTHPVVAADLEQHARADRGAQAPLPVPLARLPEHRARARDRAPARARAVRDASRASSSRSSSRSASSTSRSRRRSRSRSTGRARCCCSAPTTSTRDVFRETMSIIVKHRTDLDTVAERVGVRLGAPQRREPAFDARVLELRRGAARRGRRDRHVRAQRRVRRARRGRRGPSRGDFREALAATLAKSPEDRRVFDLVFDRFFFRAAEAEALRQGVREGGIRRGRRGRITGGERIDLDNLREQLLQAIRDGDDAAMRDLARLAIAAFGRRGEGSGVLGVDVQRIRRALGLRSEPGGPVQDDRARPSRASPATRSAASSSTCGASSSARRSSAPRRCRRRGR